MPPDDVRVRTVAGVLGAGHSVLFQRIRDLALAGHTNAEVAAAGAAGALTLLEPVLGDYAVA